MPLVQYNDAMHRNTRKAERRGKEVVLAEVVAVAMAVGNNRRETAGGGGKSIQLVSQFSQTQQHY